MSTHVLLLLANHKKGKKMLKNKLLMVVVITINLASCGSFAAKKEKNKQLLEEISAVQKCAVFKNSVCPMDLHKNDEFIVSADSEGKVEIWSLNSNEKVIALPHQEGVPIVVFSDDGKYVATGSYDSVVRVWNSESGSLIKELKGHEQIVFKLAFSPDGSMLASASADDNVILWNLETEEHHVLNGHMGDVWGLSFSPDNALLLTGGEDHLIHIWNVKNQKRVNTLTAHNGAVLSIEFSNDGKLMATGGDDYSVKLWSTVDWQVLKTLEDDSYSIYDLQFSPDDKWLVSSGRDKGLFGEFLQYHFQWQSGENSVSARVWDVESGGIIQRLNGHKDDTDNIRFTSDGSKLISSGVDGRIITYNIVR